MNQNQMNEFRSQVNGKSLKINCNSELKNIQFVNEFQIEELEISHCKNLIPKLNSKNIKQLNLQFNGIKQFEFDLPNLETLSVQENNGESKYILQRLHGFEKLQELIITGYKEIDLMQIKMKLNKLWLWNCNLTNIEKLQTQNLTELVLYDNENIDINPIQHMKTIQILNLGCCGLKNIAPLKYLVQLKQLVLSGNENIDIHFIQYLKQLTTLNLELCSLIDLTYIKPLINLKELNIKCNNIVYLEPLKDLKQIINLYAQSNKIIDAINLPNANIFNINDQELPDDEKIMHAKIILDINQPIAQLREIIYKYLIYKSKITLKIKNINKSLQRIYNIKNQFVTQVQSLFLQLNSHQDQ
ncbi:leucine-rich_repeat domain-containing protein [Hexamita inflata]|uniref:Partial n=1 Tax=Hexamita inflata TaxID=28002 RepID=A0ABP1IZR0_9EUKA